jgi:hypothetical protein
VKQTVFDDLPPLDRGNPGDGDSVPAPVPGGGIVAACAHLVPSDRRAEWNAEWLGELSYAWHVRRQSAASPAIARASLVS